MTDYREKQTALFVDLSANANRAARAREAIRYYTVKLHDLCETEPADQMLRDFLADAMHAFGSEDVRQAVEVAETNYQAEKGNGVQW